jgi:hypothetical protein
MSKYGMNMCRKTESVCQALKSTGHFGEAMDLYAMCAEADSVIAELAEALQNTLAQCLVWQGEPHEDSCTIHKTIVEQSRAALEKARVKA